MLAWTGATIAISACLGLVAWGTSVSWLLGLALSLALTTLLFVAGLTLSPSDHGANDGAIMRPNDATSSWNDATASQDAPTPSHDAETASYHTNDDTRLLSTPRAQGGLSHRSDAAASNLLLLLAVIGLACSGLYLPINLLRCDEETMEETRGQEGPHRTPPVPHPYPTRTPIGFFSIEPGRAGFCIYLLKQSRLEPV